MKSTTLALLLSFGSVQLAAQKLTIIQPKLSSIPDLSLENQARFAWFQKALTGDVEVDAADSAAFNEMLYTIGETRESPCEVIGMECSWYCGGGPDSVWASSTLAPIGTKKYDAQQAHDLDYCAVWSEGAAGNGVGQWLAYRFAPESPRLHTVLVSNGLVQNAEAWKNNNRVKRLLVSENGVPVVELHLEDSRDDQAFKLPRLFGQRSDGKSMVLTFTILEVYPGDRFEDAVISEIWFDGTDVH